MSAMLERSAWKRRLLARTAALLLACCAAPALQAQAESPSARELASTLPGRIGPQHLRVLDVAVGEDGLEEVAAILGPAVRFAPGGSEHVVAVCYAAGARAGDVAVMFQSARTDAESIVNLVHVAPRSALLGAARRCAPLPRRPASELATPAGVALGMSRTELLRRFGVQPSEDGPRALGFYYYEPLAPAAEQRGRCQLLSGLRARLDAHGVRSFLVYRLHSGAGC